MRPLLLLAAMALAMPAAAQNRARASADMGREFAATDANKDGAISLAEVEKRIGAMRAGKAGITQAQARQLAALWFARADANKDGRVTKPEADALLTSTFRAYDRDGDGKVTPAERAAARADVLKQGRAR